MKTSNEPVGSVLVDAAWLDAHLHDPAVRVVEVDVSRRAHDEWHIEGAVLWNVYGDLKDAGYRLIETAAIEDDFWPGPPSDRVHRGVLRLRAGAGLLAAEAVRTPGCTDPRRLARGLGGRRTSGGPPDVRARPNQLRAARTGPAAAGRTRGGARRDRPPGSTLLDVRSLEEYQGERFWPSGGLEPGGRAGHVPSAVHQPIDGLYDERGRSATPATCAASSPPSTSTARTS